MALLGIQPYAGIFLDKLHSPSFAAVMQQKENKVLVRKAESGGRPPDGDPRPGKVAAWRAAPTFDFAGISRATSRAMPLSSLDQE